MDIDFVDGRNGNHFRTRGVRESGVASGAQHEAQTSVCFAGGHPPQRSEGGIVPRDGDRQEIDLKVKRVGITGSKEDDSSCGTAYGSSRGSGSLYEDEHDNEIASRSVPVSATAYAAPSYSGRPRQEQKQGGGRGRISIRSLLQSSTSTPPISPAIPNEEYFNNTATSPSSHTPLRSGSIYSPVPLPPPLSYRPRSSLGTAGFGSNTTIRPIRRPQSRPRLGSSLAHSHSFNTSRQRASPYNIPGLVTDMLNSNPNFPSTRATPSPMASPHSQQHQGRLSPPGLNSPGSMSARRRAPVPTWPLAKSSRSHSFNSQQTPRDLYQTLKTPAALRVPPTAYQSSPIVPIRRIGTPPTSAPPLSPARMRSAPQPITPGRVWLLDVPRAQVIRTLNERAGKYWFDPSSADCNLYVPVSRKRCAPSFLDHTPDYPLGKVRDWPFCPTAPSVPEGIDPEEGNIVTSHRYHNGRRGSIPQDDDVPVMIFPLHRDYLVTQSRLLRAVLTSQSPTRASFPQTPSPTTTPQARYFPASASGTPGPPGRLPPKAIKGARILPPKEGEPVSIFLPVPDPASIGIVLHWLYWGDSVSLEKSFSKGMATWQGVVKNIEYLALDDSIKRVMGKWWRTWVKTDVGRRSSTSAIEDEGGSRRPATSDGLPVKRGEREFSVTASSEGGTDEDQEEMEVDGYEREIKREVDGDGEDDGVVDLLKRL